MNPSEQPPQLPTQPGMVSPQGMPPIQGGQTPLVPARPATNPNSTQNTLHISEIRDGIVIMSDGSFRSVVMCKSINFDLMSPQEREAVEYSYQGFLNSLYFPVQITIQSRKVDMRPYIQKLDKIRGEHDNMLLALLMEDYINFIADVTDQTNIMDKRFYITVPYPTPDDENSVAASSRNFIETIFGKKDQHVVINEEVLEKGKTELKNRVQAVIQGLMQAGVQSLPLDTEELIELYYDSYNPDTATRQQLKNYENLTAPVVTKGVGTAATPGLDRELNP